jgi:cold shock CspA family protein/ribosome-associated translation inhibitor RaiA
MERPLSLVTRGLALTPPVEDDIRTRVAALERFYPRLVGCTVFVDGPGRHHRRGGPYEVRLDLRVPGAEPILITRQQQERLERAVDEAFDVAARRLEDLQRVQRAEVKRRAEPQQPAWVARLVPGQDHGFLATPDGREIYFHRNSVLGDFDALAPGTKVRFQEGTGDEGPQASTVIVVD